MSVGTFLVSSGASETDDHHAPMSDAITWYFLPYNTTRVFPYNAFYAYGSLCKGGITNVQDMELMHGLITKVLRSANGQLCVAPEIFGYCYVLMPPTYIMFGVLFCECT